MSRSLGAAYFEALYATDPDPWRFASSAYEAAKYADTLDALPSTRFGSALEVGCSIGVLTRALAARCDALLSIDVAAAALDQARARCADLAHVRFERAGVPDGWPVGSFDLIVFSEVLYYLSRADLERTTALACTSLRPGGAVILVHWTKPTNYPLSGDVAAERFLAAASGTLTVTRRERRDAYRLDVARRP